MRRMMLTVAAVSIFTVASVAQQPSPSPSPAFDVVSVKRNTSQEQGGAISPVGSQFRAFNIPLRIIITYAYNVRDLELVDAPGWTSAERFDISATYSGAKSPTQDEARLMVQRVLAERFALRAHRETRDMPIYRLVKARDDGRLGPNLVPSDVDCVKWLADKKPQIIGTPPVGPGGARPACLLLWNRNYVLGGTKPIRELAQALEGLVTRRVVDATGLTGNFDVTLLWTPTVGLDVQPTAPTGAAGADTVSLFAAIQEQLGLKLEPALGPVEVLVIDSVERPTPD